MIRADEGPASGRAGGDDRLGFTPDWADPGFVVVYDELPLWSAMAGLLLLEHVPMRPEMTVADVGAGTGFPLLELAERLGPRSRVVGLDPWGAALERANAKRRRWSVERCAIVRGHAEAMPLASGRFDLVTSNLGINNFADPLGSLVQCARLLRDGGVIALTTNLQGHLLEFYDVFAVTLRELDLDAALEALREHIAHRATIEGLRAWFESAGLRVTRVVERTAGMRFASGRALLGHHFIRLGFLEAWRNVVDPDRRREAFERLELDLDRVAERRGELTLSVPLAYVEGTRA
jgi:ubiquinone/menaquinone biosynthesis C-methylase UbiE